MDDLRQEISELRALLAREYARREAHDYTLREVVDEDGVHPVPSDAEAARRAGFSAAAGFTAPGTPGAPGAAAAASAEATSNTAQGAVRAGEPADSSVSHEVAVREQEPAALLEETRQTFTIIREKFSLRSRKQ